MKKIIAIITITLLVFSLTACGKDEITSSKEANQSNGGNQVSAVESLEASSVNTVTSVESETTTSVDSPVASDPTSSKNQTSSNTSSKATVTTPGKTSSTPSKVSSAPSNTSSEIKKPNPAPVVNEYINNNNNTFDANNISVKPRHVYWKDGKLFAECFVINGFTHNVFNINVKSLKFNNGSVDIASADFGVLNNLTLEPHTHTLWTFEFPANCVQNYGADLSRLICDASVSNNY